jgi:hypothetical protein
LRKNEGLTDDSLFSGVRLVVFVVDLTMKKVGTKSFEGLTAVRFEPVTVKVTARSTSVKPRIQIIEVLLLLETAKGVC